MNIYSLIFTLFCFVFYGIAGIASEGPAFSVMIALQILTCAMLLSRQKVFTYEMGPTSNRTLDLKFWRLYRILILFAAPYFFFLALHGVPALSARPEMARVEFSAGISIYDRFYPVVFYLLLLMSFFGFSTTNELWRKSLFVTVALVILSGFIMSGYRARAVDGFILVAIAAAVARQGGISKISLRALARFAVPAVVVLAIGLIPATYLTMIRFETGDWSRGIELIYWRVFQVNYETNIPRIDQYVGNFGIGFGSYYIGDILSIFLKDLESSQVVVTSHFSSQGGIFVMTTTFLGESILNFGRDFILLSIIPFFILVSFNKLALRAISAPAMHHHFETSVHMLALYYITRIVPTGGISNAFATKLLPLYIVATCVVLCLFIISRKIRVRRI